ncbi:MAG: ArsR family transcriptional regulator [Acidobacteria bacterium]|nr:MAG: ArsR family transcriptional regulator [Acidobacteriota bacterium]REJ99427.1 MAG: ArsR family transcriptional regulator [Acidobacteriota bacterium]
MNTIFKALSHPVRRQIVVMLRGGPMSSGQIAEAFDMAWPSVTAHLKVLRRADLVDAERDGTSIRYRLKISAAEEAMAFLIEMFGSASGVASREQTLREESEPA